MGTFSAATPKAAGNAGAAQPDPRKRSRLGTVFPGFVRPVTRENPPGAGGFFEGQLAATWRRRCELGWRDAI
jgi:hypothetical protein